MIKIKQKSTLDNQQTCGKRVSSNGYIEVYDPLHPRARKNGYVFEHILVIEEKIGEPLKIGEEVHHLNGDKQDNRAFNLMRINKSDHSKLHGKERRKGVYFNCVICNEEFYRKPSHAKNAKCCSLSCAGKYSHVKQKEVER